MTTLTTDFPTPGPINLKVELQAGDVTLSASNVETTTVRLIPHGRGGEEAAERFTVEARGNDVVVIAPKERGGFLNLGRGSVDVAIELPTGSTLDIKTGSGDISGKGSFDNSRVTTGSGDVTFEELASADIKSGSGDLSAHVVRGEGQFRTGSGDISIDTAHGELDLNSGSGDIFVRRAESRLRTKTGSGDITLQASANDVDVLTGTGDVSLAAIHAGEVRVKTGTGDVQLGVASGTAAFLDLNTVTGDVKVDLDDAAGPGDAESQATLTVHSGSGDIRVKKAQVSMS